MDYKKINTIVEECLKYDVYTDVMDEFYTNVIPLCKKIIKEGKSNVSNKNFSTDYSLQNKLKLISNFFKTIDIKLYYQFETIISSVDENGKALVNFSYNNDIGSSGSDTNTGKMNIHLADNLGDIFIIIHEIIHYMNFYIIELEKDNKLEQAHFKYLFNESAPIIAEKLLGEWLIKKGYITENDFNIIQDRRLNSTINIARFLIIESEYIKLNQKGIEITKESLEKRMEELSFDPITQKVLKEELENNKIKNTILRLGMLNFPQMQKYIIAHDLEKDYNLNKDGINRFLELHKKLGDPNIIK